MSAVGETVAWASGNHGAVVRTTDGGATWAKLSVPGAENLDFRDIEAFGADTAYLRSAVAYLPGSAGQALVAVGPQGGDLSGDGGATWESLGDEGFHAFSISAPGNAAWAVGDSGRISKLVVTTGRVADPAR